MKLRHNPFVNKEVTLKTAKSSAESHNSYWTTWDPLRSQSSTSLIAVVIIVLDNNT